MLYNVRSNDWAFFMFLKTSPYARFNIISCTFAFSSLRVMQMSERTVVKYTGMFDTCYPVPIYEKKQATNVSNLY